MQNRSLILAFVGGALVLLCLGIGAGVGIAGYLANQNAQNTNEQMLSMLETRDAAETVAEGETAAVETEDESVLPAPPTLNIPATETPTPTNTLPPTETPTSTNTPTSTPTSTATPTNTSTPTPTPSPTPTREGPQARVIEDAGFFAGPGTSFGRRNYFATPGEIVVVLGVSDPPGWWHVISNENSYEGWVSSRFFELISGEIASASVSTYRATPFVTAEPAGSAAGGGDDNAGAPPPTDSVAFWFHNTGAAQGQPGGTWSSELFIRVPTGFSYEFELGIVVQDATRIVTDEGGLDTYRLDISGMGCSSAYIADLIVLQNGARMVVRNEFNNQPGPIYIEYNCG